MKVTLLRRLSLTVIFLMLILSPLTQTIRTFRQDPHPYPYSPLIQNETTRKFIKLFDHSARETLDPFYNFITVGTYTGNFYGLKFSEPLNITNHFFSSLLNFNVLNIPMLTTMFLTALIYLVFGRVFCGYICPMSLLTSINQKLQRSFLNRKKSIYRSKAKIFYKKYKWIYLSVFAFIFINPLVLQFILPPALIQHSVSDYILHGSFTLWSGVFVLLLIYELLRPGDFCKHLCPTGIFLTFTSKFKRVKLEHSEASCPTGCTDCIDTCWLGLNPKGNDIGESACDLCHRCVSVCPVKRIKLNIKGVA